MFNHRHNKSDQQTNAAFPTTKLKNITCVYCSLQFVLKNLKDLRKSSVPLLLPCGHPFCNQCLKKHGRDPCPVCTSLPEPSSTSRDSNPPVNIYLVGLIALSQPSPAYGAEPDISFPQKNSSKSKLESYKEDHCSNCGYRATLRCLDCKLLLCPKCYHDGHSDLKTAEKHRIILLQGFENESIFEAKICTTHNVIMDYYCETCSFPSCHHCMLQSHPNHKIVPQATKNEEYMLQLKEAENQLADTIERINQAKKKIKKVMIFPEELQKNETVEKAINKHFVLLHGILQNIEKRLTDQLYEQRNILTENLKILQQRLNAQESQLQSALTKSITATDLMNRINLKDIVSKMEKLARDAHCYLVQDPILNTDNILFQPDPSIISALEEHCKLEIPIISGYDLHRENTLPKDYKMEPLAEKSNICVDNSICSESSTMKNASSCLSLDSQRSEAQLKKNDAFIPVKICHVENPSNFYVCRVSNLAKLAELNERLDNYASQNEEIPSEIVQNSMYGVKNKSTHKWYRGRVTAINSNAEKSETYEVLNVDEGSVEHEVSKEHMRYILEPLTSEGLMVMHCSMHNVVPKNGAWSAEACKEISKYQESGETLSMFTEYSSGNTYYVDLIRDHSKQMISAPSKSSIRDYLIFRGLGVCNSAFQLLRRTPNAVLKFYVEDLEISYYHDVIVSHVESPDCIHVQKIDCSRYIQNMMNELNAFYNDKAKSDDRLIYVPEIGLTCAALNTNGCWYRAVISKETTMPRMVTVTLVDFGTTITVNFDKIRTLHEKFMGCTTQAIKTSLADIEPVDGEWDPDCLTLLSEHLKNPFVRVFVYEKTGDAFTVSLTTSTGINMAALLIAKGLAISSGPRSSGVVEAQIAPPKKKNCKSKVRNTRTVKKKKKINVEWTDRLNQSRKESDDPFKLRVKILRVVSPDAIYVADPENDKTYNKLVAKMQKFYERYEQHSIDGEWKIDDQCAVYSACDKRFCRGKIIGFNNPKEAQVFLYDLTYTENIPVADLQPLKDHFWKTQIYAFKVKLAGLRPCGGSSKWPTGSCQTLKDLITENQTCKFYISKAHTVEKEDLEVELWVEQVKIAGPLAPGKIELNSINKLLVSRGMALPLRQYEKKTKILAAELKRQISNANEQEKSTDKKKGMNGTFRKKEQCGDIDSPQKIDSDDESDSSDEDDSSYAEENDITNFSVVNSSSNEDVQPDQEIEQTSNEWLPAEPILDDQFTAMITNVDFDCRLYLHSINQSRAVLHYIEKTLAETYNKMEVTPRDLVWEKGDLCIAQYHSNKKWYRGQVHGVLENGMIEVEFIDYGNVEECENGTLRKTLALLDIPRQGALCVIYGLVPNTNDGKWPIIDLDRIHGVIVDHECEIFVRKRKPDHLVVSLMMLNPSRCELIKFLCNSLQLNIRTDSNHSKSSNDDSDNITDNDQDVVVEGYIPGDEYELCEKKDPDDDLINDCIKENEHQSLEEKDREDIEEIVNDNDGIIEKNDENNVEETIDNCDENNTEKSNEMEDHNEEESEETIHDQIFCSASPEPSTSQTIHDSESTIVCNDQDVEVAENGRTIASSTDEDIISGTISFTVDSEVIDLNMQAAMDCSNALDSISLPDTTIGLREDDLTASTPYNKSFEVDTNQIKPIVIPDNVTLVKVEIAAVGIDKFLLHVLGNNSSKILSQQRQLYEDMMNDMQAHANHQPVLKLLKPGEVCCAKYADGQWYRCKVVSSESEPYELGHTVNVYFIDFGNHYCLKSDHVRVLKEEWCEAPCMLIYCGLWNIIANPTIDQAETSLEICDFFESQQCTRSKKPRTFFIEIVDRVDELYQIEMYNDANCTVLTYQPIIDKGLYLKETDLKAGISAIQD